MAKSYLNLPFDDEIFISNWKSAPDLYLTTLLDSGVMVYDGEIASKIANGSNFATVPFYDVLTGTPQTYNGVNDIATNDLKGGSYSLCVYGRQQGWNAKSFINDFNSGADPMQQIVNGVANFWIKQRQKRLIGVLSGVFGITGDTEFAKHVTDITTATASITTANKLGATTIGDAVVKACGDGADGFNVVLMHSVPANNLAGLQLLEYAKYTDSMGIQRPLPIAYANGYTIIINDNLPVEEVNVGTTEAPVMTTQYTSYALGAGCLRFASAPVEVPVEMERSASKFGGQDFIYTRIRECIHPYGFSFKGDVTTDVGIPDDVLFAGGSYERKFDAKAIKMVKILSNG